MRRVVIVLAAASVLAVPLAAEGAHVRPKGAFKVHFSLVPSYQACTAPDRTHGPPLAFPSCSNPDQASSHLTVGTPDANGSAAQSVASFRWYAYPGVPGPPTDNVSVFDAGVSDVRCTAAGPGCAAPGADYAGSLEVRLPTQLSDHNNATEPGGGGDPATTQWFNIGFTVPCTMTSDPAIGSICSRNIHYLENVTPGGIPDGKRTVWELGQIEFWDGGSDADGSTPADNTKFAVQGVFVP